MRVVVTGVAALLLSAPVGGTSLEILLQPIGNANEWPSALAQVEVVPLDTETGGEPILREGSIPGPIVVEVEPGRVYQVSVSVAGFWVPERVIRSEEAVEDLTLALYPTGTLAGKVRVAGGTTPPSALSISFSASPEAVSEVPDGRIECPVEAGAFHCDVPAGVLDLRLRSRGHVSRYLWSETVAAREAQDIGWVTLEPGASIVGWISASTREFDYEKVQVVTSPRMLGVGSGLDLERMGTVTEKTRVNRRGFFEFSGVAPGSYVVQILHPDYATSTVAPVTVLDGAETEIRDIELQPPATLEVQLWPPRHPLSRWLVALHRKSPVPGYSDLVEEGVASEEGRWVADELEPGPHLLRVLDRRGSTWTHQEIEVAAGMTPLEITLPMMRLEGTVVFDDEPLEARLFFGGKHGAESVRIDSDEEGKFYVFIPERDSWFVDVVSSRPRIETRVEGLQFRQSTDDRWAKTRVEVPDTRLTGQVVDMEGQPVAGATVDGVGPTSTSASTETGTSGHFELLGLQEGSWSFESSLTRDGRTSSSERVNLQVSEDNEPPQLRLVLREERRLAGTVIGPNGHGVPGATILPFPLAGGVRVTDHLSSLTTNVDGGFELSVADRTDEILLAVFPPGFDVTQTRIDPRSSDPILIPVGARGGTLRIRYREIPEDTSGLSLRAGTVVFADSSLLLPFGLESWAKAQGVSQKDRERFVIPNLAPGPYTACLNAGPEPHLTGRPPADGGRCASGFLPPFGDLELTLTPARKDEPTSDQETSAVR